MKSFVCLLFACLPVGSVLAQIDVGPVPDDLRSRQNLDTFYQKHATVKGLPVLGSKNVSDHALKEAVWILRHMLRGRDDILETMAGEGVHVAVMAYSEYTSDVPEHRNLKPRVFWDRRARGLGGSPVSCGEENLLCYPNDPYAKENLLIHEFAHGLHMIALRKLDPTFDRRLRTAYKSAVDRGLWKGTYAVTDRKEYWAEAVQSWFDDNREDDALHNHVNTRDELKQYDPALAKLCAEVFGDGPWRYKKPMQRSPEGRAHLKGFDPSKSPRFRWRTEPIPDQPRVLVQTEMGDIQLELDYAGAPVTVKNFLRYVHEGFYNDGIFFRTVTSDNQPTDKVKIAVIQARADPSRKAEMFDPIPLERTRSTGIQHLNGTVSMARDGPDTAQHHFFICIGNQPALDYGGRRNPDGQGFAAFGKVIEGMDVVRKIHGSKCDKQILTPAIRIQRAIRRN